MIFILDFFNQGQEAIFSRKNNKISHPTTTFNAVPVARTPCQKHFGWYLGKKLDFSQYINVKTSKPNKRIEKFKKVSHIIPRISLITI